MAIAFEKRQIVSSTKLIRSFAKYVEKELSDHDIFVFKKNMPEAVLIAYDRYEQLVKELEELKEMLEHIGIYDIVKKRKGSPVRELSLEKLQKKYGL